MYFFNMLQKHNFFLKRVLHPRKMQVSCYNPTCGELDKFSWKKKSFHVHVFPIFFRVLFIRIRADPSEIKHLICKPGKGTRREWGPAPLDRMLEVLRLFSELVPRWRRKLLCHDFWKNFMHWPCSPWYCQHMWTLSRRRWRFQSKFSDMANRWKCLQYLYCTERAWSGLWIFWFHVIWSTGWFYS